MSSRTNTILVLAYGVIAMVVIAVALWSGSQYLQTERLIAELNEQRDAWRDGDTSGSAATPPPRKSIRPSLVRLQNLLEQRAELVREQRSQIKQQMEGREELQQKYDALSAAYDKLQNEHELLVNEVEFYLNAFNLVESEEGTSGLDSGSGSAVSGVDPELAPTTETAAESPSVDPLELAALEIAELQQQVSTMNTTMQRDWLIAGYATSALVDMGPDAVPLLAGLLSDNSADARSWAAWVLGQIGPDAVMAVPEIEALLKDENENVSKAAEDALRLILVK